jgi:hypothetical protein
MTLSLSIQRLWTEPMTKCLAACLCLTMASGLVLTHVRAIDAVREVSVPTAKRVTALQQRLDLLRQQMEASQAQATLKGDSQEEVVRQAVLPAAADLARIITLFDLLRDRLSADGIIRDMSPVTVGDAVPTNDDRGLLVSPVDVRFRASKAGVESVLLFFELSGYLTVGDALTSSEREQLLTLTERENAAGLPALEEFLRLPLLTYARGAQAARDELLKSFGSTVFVQSLENVIKDSRLPQVRYLLGGTFGQALQDQGLWPLRFMTVDSTMIAPVDDETEDLTLHLSAYSRTEDPGASS